MAGKNIKFENMKVLASLLTLFYFVGSNPISDVSLIATNQNKTTETLETMLSITTHPTQHMSSTLNPKDVYEVAEMVTNLEVQSFCESLYNGQQVMEILFTDDKTKVCEEKYKKVSYSKLVARIIGETLFFQRIPKRKTIDNEKNKHATIINGEKTNNQHSSTQENGDDQDTEIKKIYKIFCCYQIN
nr:uncharacterized protein LOC124808021 [Hydra vulgaris]